MAAEGRLDADGLPNYAGSVHGKLWQDAEGSEEGGLSESDKTDPVFGKVPETTEYGGSDC